MFLTNQLSTKFSLISSYVYFALSLGMVLYYYRLGGSRDFGLYVNAGQAFMSGENAYETQLWRSGSFGTSVIWLISLPAPSLLEPLIFQLISITGFFLFGNLLGIAKDKKYWIYGSILYLSPIREVLNTIQITGFVIGLFAISLFGSSQDLKVNPKIKIVLQGLALAIAIDLKPHSILFIVVLLFVKKMKRDVILWALGICLVGHSMISLFHGNLLEISWFRSLLNLGNASGENGESTSIWKIVDYISGGAVDTNLASILSIACLFLLVGILGQKISQINLIFFGLIASSLMTYMHYYDLAPLSIFALVYFSKKRLSILGLTCVMFMILPREIDSIRNLLFLVILTFLLIRFIANKPEGKLSALLYVGSSTAIFLGVHLVNHLLALGYRLGHALVTTQTMIFAIWFLFIKLDLFRNFKMALVRRERRERGI